MSIPPENEELNQVMTKGEVIAPLDFDPDEYREDIAELGLTKEQENEVLAALYYIMKTFVEIGWGVDTLQMFFPELLENNSQDSGKLVEINHTKQFNSCAEQSTEKAGSDG